MKYAKAIMLILLILQACREEEAPAINPQEFFIGKWETVEMGNWPDMFPVTPSGYTEFTEDSIARFFDYELNAYTNHSTYWVTDSLLIEAYEREDGFKLLFKRHFTFEKRWPTKDHLRLDIVGSTYWIGTSILRRVN